MQSRWDRAGRRQHHFAGGVTLRFQHAAQPADAMARGLDDVGRRLAMAVAGCAFEVGVELESVHRELAVALQEAHGERTRAQHALDADRDLRLVGALDEDASAGGLEDGGVVETHTLAARELRLLVGIDGEHRQQRIAPAHHLQDVARALPDGILAAVEIGDVDRRPHLIDDRHRLADGV